MTTLTAGNKADWALWAASAPPRRCTNCDREFRPNHPRRWTCGLPDCQEATARLQAERQQQQTQARSVGVQGLLADVLIEVNTREGPEGTRRELSVAMREVLQAEQRGLPTRTLYVRLMAAAGARALTVDRRSNPGG